MRNASLYILRNGNVIKDGDTMDGRGSVCWRAKRYENGVSDPPREVLRWLPFDQSGIPEILRDKTREPETTPKKKPAWKFW
jgi:Domain of unknown function (DUF4261)